MTNAVLREAIGEEEVLGLSDQGRGSATLISLETLKVISMKSLRSALRSALQTWQKKKRDDMRSAPPSESG